MRAIPLVRHYYDVPRRPRLVIPGAAHHLTQRGNFRQNTFCTSGDRLFYLQMLREQASRYKVQILGWCLMTNHVHLIVVPEEQRSIGSMIRQVHPSYSRVFNHKAEHSGHLWQNRYYSCVLEGTHLLRAIRYVELNPVRAGLVTEAWNWPWSSAVAHCRAGTRDLATSAEWDAYFRHWDFDEWREILGAGLPDQDLSAIRRSTTLGEPWGGSEFIQSIEQKVDRKVRVLARGRPPLSRSAATG